MMLATGGLLGLLLMGAAVGGLMAGAEPGPTPSGDDGPEPDDDARHEDQDRTSDADGLARYLDLSGGMPGTAETDGNTTPALLAEAPGPEPQGGGLSQLLFGMDVHNAASNATGGAHAGPGEPGPEETRLGDPMDILREAGLDVDDAVEAFPEVQRFGEVSDPIPIVTADGDASDGAPDLPAAHPADGLLEIVETVPFGDGPDLPLVTDFDTATDRLVLDFEGAANEAPVISVDLESAPGDAIVRADDLPVTVVKGAIGLTPDLVDIVMTGPSLVEGLVTDIAELVEDLPLPALPDVTAIASAVESLLDGGSISDAAEGRAALHDVLSGSGLDALTGGFGDDSLTGSSLGDAMFGDEGDDTLRGGGGNDELSGDAGNDLLDGGAGTDFLDGGEGDDTLRGGDGSDLAFGGDGDDLIEGGDGDDGLQGGMGADTILGGDGNDVIDGTFARIGPADQDAGDVIDGGSGDDTIRIGSGDMVTGGADADTFVAALGTGPVGTVTDFDPNEDRIEIAYDPATVTDPVVGVEDFGDGSGAAITLNGQTVLRVVGAQGLDPSEITLRPADGPS